MLKKINLQDEKLNHQINLSELTLPKNQNNLSLIDIQIKPIQINDTLSLSAKIPEIRFKNFNKDVLIQNQRFEADSMLSLITEL